MDKKRSYTDKDIEHISQIYYDLNHLYHSDTSEEIKKHITMLASASWNSLGNIGINGRKASHAAYKLSMKLSGKDPRDYNWNQQKTMLKDHKRQNLHWEHAYTRYNFVQDLFSKQLTKEEIVELVKKHQIIWITKEENSLLDKTHKKDRPKGWRDAYASVGINIIDS